MQNDYISRENLLDKLDDYEPGEDFEYEHELWLDIRLAIIHEPAADVRPVVRGEWTTKRTADHDGEWYCTNCDYEPQVYEASNYCPNCGAEMGGQDNA